MTDDLEQLTDDELNRVEQIMRINQIQQSIIESQERLQQERETSMATIEQMRLENDKFRAETAKINKETKYYPMLSIIIALFAVIGGLIVALLQKG